MGLTYQLPHETYPELFEAVQMAKVFEDSKTFVDCVPKHSPSDILRNFTDQKDNPGFDLSTFVFTHFKLPIKQEDHFESDQNQSTADHIESLWSHLQRRDSPEAENGSLLPLGQPYIVPGGRFREVYYWDSYFTMLGLAISGKIELIAHMVQNFADQIDLIGFIPNGNRTYFLSRSQPPFFSLMVELLARHKGEKIITRYTSQLQKEYQFWMESPRLVQLPDNQSLNRYYDHLNIPRAESYEEDVTLYQKGRDHSDQSNLYRNLRAACESGWDFSTRWLVDLTDLSSIEATSIIPVDLNCLLLQLERTLEKAMNLLGHKKEAQSYQQAAFQRIAAIQKYCWDAESGFYRDYHFNNETQTRINSMAGFFPLFVGIANESQAQEVIRFVSRKLLMPGGWRTTDIHSGQQWDAPNGWAPLQWIAYIALKNYGFEKLANESAQKWIELNDRVFKKTGKMMEKYNVEDLSLDAGGGEYPVQDGFGWTNGVYLALLQASTKV
jgi:alpha,alpha-trehalase